MRETIALLLGFFALVFGARPLYAGYAWLCARFAPSRPEEGPDPTPVLLTGFSLATLLMLLISLYSALISSAPLSIGSLVLAGALILLLDNILVFLGCQFARRMNGRRLSRQLLRQKRQTEMNYYQALEEQYDRQRVLIHDIRKHLAALRDLADRSGDQAVAQYVAELERAPALQNRVRVCGDPILDVILARYGEICQKQGIRFSVDVGKGNAGFLSPGDLTALFSNLLENAVEAAEKNPDPVVELYAGSRPGSRLVVTVVNSCAAAPRPDGAGGFLSWKEDPEHHGLGMKSIRGVVDKYSGGLHQYYDEGAGLFHTVVLLK